MTKLDLIDIRNDFPILIQKINGNNLAYLDNAATTHRPRSVQRAIEEYNLKYNGNPHRGAHQLSIRATEQYKKSKEKVKKFINAKEVEEIIFTKNTSEALNLIASSYGEEFIGEGDEILLAISEHHSNILPWQRLAKIKGANLKYMYLDHEYRISEKEMDDKITNRTKIVSIGHISNALGTINPVEEIIHKAHKLGATVIVDGAQAVPHMR